MLCLKFLFEPYRLQLSRKLRHILVNATEVVYNHEVNVAPHNFQEVDLNDLVPNK